MAAARTTKTRPTTSAAAIAPPPSTLATSAIRATPAATTTTRRRRSLPQQQIAATPSSPTAASNHTSTTSSSSNNTTTTTTTTTSILPARPCRPSSVGLSVTSAATLRRRGPVPLRPPSAFMLCGTVYLLLLGLLCCMQPSSALNAATYGDDGPDDGSAQVAVGRTAHEPKFGERLLPLLRKKPGLPRALSPGVAAAARSLGQPQSARSVNSFLHKSNYVVSSHEEHHEVEPEEPRGAHPTAVAVTNDPAELYTVVAVTTLDDRAAAGATNHDSSVATRQSKQLRRREDVSVDDDDDDEPPTDFKEKAANVSTADRLVVMSTEFFVVPTATTPSAGGAATATTSSSTPGPGRFGAKSRGMPVPAVGPRPTLIVASKTTVAGGNNTATPPTIVSTQPPFTGLRKEPWVVPVLVLAALTMLMMAAFEIFVLFKAWRTSPSRRHLFLGQMLLLGLFACAGLGAVITAQPSLLSCGTIRFGVGVAYALVFAALLVKCVFLISLNGGVYLPAPYQGLLLLFAVLIQVAIGAQWLLTQPPEIYTLSVPVLGSGMLASATLTSSAQIGLAAPDTSSAGERYAALLYPASNAGDHLYSRISATGTVLIPLCKTQFSELLFSLIYIVFLIVFVAVLAIKSRGIRDNYREATYIGLAIGGAIPIWLGWMLCGLAVAERHKDACIAFGLIATSATVFLVMFMPKGRQLAAMGKEGLYVEDREEQFSSLSRAGSGYSPSFFHFKPIKYGVMGGGGGGGGMQNSATNTGNGASMKHCSNAMNGGAHLTTHHPTFCFYPHQPPPPLPPQPPPPPPLTQLPSPPTLKQLGNSLSSMTQAHIAQTLRYPGLFIRPDETNLYTTLEPTLSSNPNVYFQRGGAVHPGMMY